MGSTAQTNMQSGKGKSVPSQGKECQFPLGRVAGISEWIIGQF